MHYLLTGPENQTWRGVVWGENVTHGESEDVYHYVVYQSPSVASYMYPCYEGTHNPKLWSCSGKDKVIWNEDQENLVAPKDFRVAFRTLTTLKECPLPLPTNDQRITFGILCAMNLVLNPLFRDWAFKYLRGEDITKESAHAVSEKLTAQIGSEKIPEEHDYIACAHAVLASVMLEEPALFAANAAHRAYHDSAELTSPLDLEQMIQIVEMLPPKEIAEMLS